MSRRRQSGGRRAIRAAFAAQVLLAATQAHADRVMLWRPYITEASARCGIPADWIERVMRAESAGMTMLGGAPITSRVGAMGLMQLMPATWTEMRKALGLGADPHNPRDNILAGTCYLRLMYDRFGYPGLFAAYNAGPTRYADHLATGRVLPGETRAYLALLGNVSAPQPGAGQSAPVRTIFFALRSASFGRTSEATTLFVPLRIEQAASAEPRQ